MVYWMTIRASWKALTDTSMVANCVSNLCDQIETLEKNLVEISKEKVGLSKFEQ